MSTESMVTQALEPCPFCGGPAEVGETESHLGDIFPTVHCQICRAEVVANSEAEAIAAWNTRTAAQPEREAVLARYRHKARGTEYDLIGTAELQDARGEGVGEGALLAFYRGDDGKLWARRHREFEDGRFERVAALTTPAPAVSRDEICAHNWRCSDSSLYDFKCTKCGETE